MKRKFKLFSSLSFRLSTIKYVKDLSEFVESLDGISLIFMIIFVIHAGI